MPDKRPQDVFRTKRGGPILRRRDGVGLSVEFYEQHGFDTCPEVLIVRDGWGGKAVYSVQEPYSENSHRPHTEDIAGRDLRFQTLEHGPGDDMPQAIRVYDPQGYSAVYRPLMKDGQVVDKDGMPLEPGDSGELVDNIRSTLQMQSMSERKIAEQVGVTLIVEHCEIDRNVILRKFVVRSPRNSRMPVYETSGTEEQARAAFNAEVAEVFARSKAPSRR